MARSYCLRNIWTLPNPKCARAYVESACNALAELLLGRGHFPPAEVDVAEVVVRGCKSGIAVECLEIADARFSILAALPVHNGQVVVRTSVVRMRR